MKVEDSVHDEQASLPKLSRNSKDLQRQLRAREVFGFSCKLISKNYAVLVH